MIYLDNIFYLAYICGFTQKSKNLNKLRLKLNLECLNQANGEELDCHLPLPDQATKPNIDIWYTML